MTGEIPEYGVETPTLNFRSIAIRRHFQRITMSGLVKHDGETGMPLKGSQFYL